MPSHRNIRGLHHQKKEPKPVTPLQKQMVERRKKDLENAEAAHAALLARLNNRPAGPPLIEEEADTEVYDPAPMQVDGDRPEDDEPNLIDINEYMPHPMASNGQDNSSNPVLDDLRQELHFAQRLKHETRWQWQHAVMLLTFLRCRQKTSNWGNEANWNKDFAPPCTCAGRTERDVDLVESD
ncbi:hypothetical protein DFH28DRAFT_885621 [Melampsora americana]|nr:hypothetical protein DFH28DRAFT_885621 [Melampsora americana]